MATLPASFWRGGVCNALIFLRSDLPKDRSTWQKVLSAAMGSPDPYGRQLNGMGGGNSSLSKVCIVSPSQRDDADIDFEFVQVVIGTGTLDYASNCGNMSAAIGPFAIDRGLLAGTPSTNGCAMRPGSPTTLTTARIYNTNTRKIIHSTFPVSGSPPRFLPSGDYKTAGVAGTASRIRLSFISPGGTQTGMVLPTGEALTLLDTSDLNGNRVSASLVDVANPGVIIDGQKLGVDANTKPSELDQRGDMMALLEKIRREGAERMGLDPEQESVPKIVLAFRPDGQADATGQAVTIRCVVLSMGQSHKAIPLTLALNLGAACCLEGTIPFTLAAKTPSMHEVLIQHPSGTITVAMDVAGPEVKSASLYSSARLLMQGDVNVV